VRIQGIRPPICSVDFSAFSTESRRKAWEGDEFGLGLPTIPVLYTASLMDDTGFPP
jgi:hypothetical protein